VSGAFIGAAVACVTALGFEMLGPRTPTPSAAHVVLLLMGMVGGPLLGALITFWLLAPLASPYRRGGLAVVSGFAAFVAMFAGMPVHQAFGQAGLALFALLFGITGAAFFARARQATRP
jgi:hypothetical protein